MYSSMSYCITPGREGHSQALQVPGTEKGWSREQSGEMGLERVAGGLHPACPWLLALLHGPYWHQGKSPTCPTVCASCQVVPWGWLCLPPPQTFKTSALQASQPFSSADVAASQVSL